MSKFKIGDRVEYSGAATVSDVGSDGLWVLVDGTAGHETYEHGWSKEDV